MCSADEKFANTLGTLVSCVRSEIKNESGTVEQQTNFCIKDEKALASIF